MLTKYITETRYKCADDVGEGWVFFGRMVARRATSSLSPQMKPEWDH